jgi:riboflavin kinase / FMN adenylyltransferase
MKLLTRRENFQECDTSVIITLGNFDGVHKGHQAILSAVNALKRKTHGCSVVMTFTNHPSTILHEKSAPGALSTLQQKMRFFEQEGVDIVIALPFTYEMAQRSPQEFILWVGEYIPFSFFVFGEGAALGKNASGGADVMHSIAQEKGFEVKYVETENDGGGVISSSRIRQCVRDGDLDEAKRLLGREYSLFGPVVAGQNIGKKIGVPTVNIDITGLCLPPRGVYAVRMKTYSDILYGVANIGVSPTVKHEEEPLLEVHLLDYEDETIPDVVEVTLEGFIRAEQTFESINALVAQISCDVIEARNIFAMTCVK